MSSVQRGYGQRLVWRSMLEVGKHITVGSQNHGTCGSTVQCLGDHAFGIAHPKHLGRAFLHKVVFVTKHTQGFAGQIGQYQAGLQGGFMAPLQNRKTLSQQLVQKHQLAAGQLHFGLRHQLARRHPSLMAGNQA